MFLFETSFECYALIFNSKNTQKFKNKQFKIQFGFIIHIKLNAIEISIIKHISIMSLIKTRNQIHVGTHQGLSRLYQTEKFVLVYSRTELAMKERKVVCL